MHAMDLPPDRSLDAARDPAGDRAGNPRSPAELLDNLRLRLGQLADNHPSAVAGSSSARRLEAAQEQAPPRERDDHGPREQHRDDHGETAGRETAGGSALADIVRGVKDVADALTALQLVGGRTEIELVTGSDGADPYRPWFMSGEPTTPWFASRPDL